MKTLPSLILMICLVCADLVFKIESIADGPIIYDYKEKYQKLVAGEDASCTSELSLAVADGIGSSPFISYYYASALTFATTIKFLDERLKDPNFSLNTNEDIVQFFDKAIMDEIDQYKKHTNIIEVDLENDTEMNENDKNVALERRKKALGILARRELEEVMPIIKLPKEVSTTFIGAFLESTQSPNVGHGKLNIYQRGDSVLVVFRPIKYNETETYTYVPIYQTVEMQEKFNFPYQFTTSKEFSFNLGTSKQPQDKVQFSLADSIEVMEHDLVIAGSDGFFDNIHLSFTTYLVNFLVDSLSVEKVQMSQIRLKLEEVIKKYLDVFKKHYKDLDRKKKAAQEARRTQEHHSTRQNVLFMVLFELLFKSR